MFRGEMQDAELERWKRDQVQKAEERLHKAMIDRRMLLK